MLGILQLYEQFQNFIGSDIIMRLFAVDRKNFISIDSARLVAQPLILDVHFFYVENRE